MELDFIAAIGIDPDGRLFVKPVCSKFPLVYREAAEVHWDEKKDYLYSPVPREWSYEKWLEHIISVAKAQGVELVISKETQFHNLPPDLERTLKEIQ
jgi:hypothetical protein